MEDLNIDNIEKLLKSEPSEQLLYKAIKGLKVEKKNKKSRLILISICGILGIIVGIHQETVIIFRESIDATLSVLLALFGVIFMGYALLQAFMNKQMILQLLKDTKVDEDGDEKSRLQDINENFVYLMLVYIAAIITSLFMKIVLFCLPHDFTLFTSIVVNDAFAFSFIAVYFSFTGIILWRTVSFASSMFHLFNIYALTRVLEMINEEEKSDL